MNKATFTGMVLAVADEQHPLQQKLQFVFTDYQPNLNNQGIPRTEAQNIIKSSMHMPVKVNFRGKPKGHEGAVPIGPIVSSYEDGDRILAEAVVWRQEFPEVAKYLETASAEEGGAQFSWEIFYRDSAEQDGVNWLQDCVVAATTIVDVPAYDGRTPLLAVAENDTLDLENLQKQLAELTEQLKTLREANSEKDSKISELETALAEASVIVTKITDLEKQVAELTTYKSEIEAKEARETAVAALREKIQKAGIDMSDEAFAERVDTFLSLVPEAFEMIIKDMAALAAKGKASASVSDRVIFPDPLAQGGSDTPSIKDVAKALREYKRN